jgi:uncharacterized repeat protein (TIGR01451 family)
MFAPDLPGNYINQAIVDPDNAIPEGNEFDNISNVPLTVANAGNAPFKELSIVKTATPSGLVENGGVIVYSLAVTNTGTDPVFNITVKDFLPAGTTFVSAWDDTAPIGPQAGDFLCTHANTVVTCTGGTLDGTSTPPDGPLGANYPTTRIIKVQVTASNVAFLDAINQAFIDPDNTIPEGDETNNTSSVLNNVRSFIDLQVKKGGPPSSGQSSTFDYEIEAINKAAAGTPGATAHNVTVHDALPVGLIVLGAVVQSPETNDWNCQVSENPVNVVDCSGTLFSGDGTTNTVKIKIKVFVTAADNLTLTNEACIDHLNTIVESIETNNCNTALTVVGTPDLAVSKTALTNPVSPGQNEVYTINVVNIGNVDATAVSIDDTLPVGTTFVAAIGTNGFTCDPPASGHVICHYTGGNPVALAKSGGTTTITLTVKVNADRTDPIINAVTATPTPAEDPATMANNTATVTTSLSGGAGIDLQLLSVQDLPDPVNQAGGVLTYTIQVVNSGTATAGLEAGKPVVIRSTISDGLNTINAVASEGFTCAPSGDDSPVTINCTSPAIGFEAGHTVMVTITAIVDASAGATITNEVKVDPDHLIVESNETNNDFTAATSVVAETCLGVPVGDPCIDLIVGTILATPEPVSGSGGTLSYTVTVSNAGNVSTTTGDDPSCDAFLSIPAGCVWIVITLPAEVSYNSGSAAASASFGCTDAFLPSLVCAGDLNASQGVVISFTGSVTASSGTAFTTTVDALLFGTIADVNSANNSQTVTNHAN